MKLTEFINRFREAISQAVIRTYPPLYNAETRKACSFDLRRLRRRPLGAQADAIRATALSLRRHAGTSVVGEMGTGKSYIGAAAAYLAGCHRILVLCPPHLVRKWQREILQTVPGARAEIVRTVGDLERVRSFGGGVHFVICSREQAKLGYRWTPAAIFRLVFDDSGGVVRDEMGRVVRSICCPTCFARLTDDEEVPLTWNDLTAKKRRCAACGSPLWQADRNGPRRYPLADYVLRRMTGYFDLLIADEMHDYKARGSAQGIAAAALAGACQKTLTLTGTLCGGYSSTLFYLLWRFSPAVRQEFGYREETRWVSRYGILERITKKDTDAYLDDGRHSKRRSYLTRTVEKPGVSPMVLFHLIGNTVFLRLADVAEDLPPYTERVALYNLDSGTDPDVPSQVSAYHSLAHDLWQAVSAALQQGSKRLLATYLQVLLAYPDACTRGETVLDHLTGDVIAYAPPLPETGLYPKEQALVELVRRERARTRRVLIYITHTERRDISPRLKTILEREGLRVAVLKASTVSADRREEWVAARVREGAEVLICHPRLVQTGLDLIDWPSIVWFEVEYSLYVMRQASRRSWRIGQRQPVEVTYMVYQGTLQAEALALVATKMRSSLMLEGELPEDGLAALESDGQDLFLALARRLTEGESAEAQSLEALFAQARQQEAESHDYLIADDWSPDLIERAEQCASAPVLLTHNQPADATANLWKQVFSDAPTDAASPLTDTACGANGRMVSFEELAQLVQRPRQRQRPPPKEQLALF